MRIFLVVLGVLIALVLGAGAYVYQVAMGLEVVRITDDLHMIKGLGGNVGVLATGDGTVLVDTMTLEAQGAAIRETAEALTGEPVVMIINTHYHFDHTHGNPAFDSGTRVVATQRTLGYLESLDAEYWTGAAADLLPNETFEHEHVIELGNKTIRLLHPGRGHTDGDLVAYFEQDQVLHMGDLYFNEMYPNIDLEAGGSIPAWIATLDRVLALDFDRAITGHGPVTDRGGILAFQGFLRELWSVGQRAAQAGLSLEETLAAHSLTTDEGYGVIAFPLVFRLDRDFVIRRAWEEATGAVKPLEIPRS